MLENTHFLQRFKTGFLSIIALIKKSMPIHQYRIISIEKDENEEFMAEVQLANTRQIFRMKPEEILANNTLTDSFSQRDIRTLTYLGYLGINSPKYKILAQHLFENDNRLILAIKERGKEKPLIKTANQISTDELLLNGLHQKDAHMIGYLTAIEQVTSEEKQKKQLKEDLKKDLMTLK